MAGRDGKKQARKSSVRRCGVVVGGALSAFATAAVITTSSAAPARADFEDLIDPIIQPILTSLTDSIGAFDPAAALDLTSWTDSLLASLNSLDFLLPSAAEPAAAVAAASEALTGTYELPLTMAIGTEPTVEATIEGAGNTLLVDTGSGGLVIPWESLGDNNFEALWNLFMLGFPTDSGLSGYSGGVEYFYLTYDNVSVDYGGGLTPDAPVDVEVFSWPTAFGAPVNFEQFLAFNHVDGILGIGENTAGPLTSPFEDYGGVLVDIPNGQLVVTGINPLVDSPWTAGAPVSAVYESVGDGGFNDATQVLNNIDSGGVFGTIPSSLAPGGSLPSGTEITVYNAGGQELYSYLTTDHFPVGGGQFADSSPTVVSGTDIDSGVVPFLHHAVYLDYANDRTYFGPLTN